MELDHDFQALNSTLGEVLDQALRLVEVEQADDDGPRLERLREVLGKARRKWESEGFQVAVLALVKSGKSTLINALLGDEYLPVANTPETARLVRVCHRRGVGSLETDGGETLAGAEAINQYLKETNKRTRESGDAPESVYQLQAPLAFVDAHKLSSRGFELLDTPGPNEAGVESLRGQVIRVLEDADVILYLLDYTKLKTQDEADLLSLLGELRPEMLRRCAERLFFVVNKVDAENRNGLSPEDTQSYVAELLARTLPGINVDAGRIIPVSAEHGLLARMIRSETASEQAVDDFKRIAFGVLGRKKGVEDCREAAPTLLDASGIEHLEDEILKFIFDNRARLLLQSLADAVDRHLAQLDNYYLTAEGALRVDHAELSAKVAALKQDLTEILEGLQQVEAAGEVAKLRLEEWVRERFVGFEDEARKLIAELFDKDPPTRRKGFFRGLWQEFQNLVQGEDRDPSGLERRIHAVHSKILGYLRYEFAGFQAELQQEAYGQQREILTELEKVIQPFATRIEERINNSLLITLTPVEFRIPEPGLAEFHHDIEKMQHSFFRRSIRTEQRTITNRVKVREGGWCTRAEYIERTMLADVDVAVHGINIDGVQAYWSGAIHALTESSVSTAVGVLDDAVRALVGRAQSEVQEYADGFIEALNSEIRESEKGRESKQARLETIRDRRMACSSLSERIRVVTGALETHGSSEAVARPRRGTLDMLILTALTEEHQVVRTAVTQLLGPPESDVDGLTLFRLRTNQGNEALVGVASAHEMGGVASATMSGRWFAQLKPAAAVLVGIAATVRPKAAQLADVVFARQIVSYDNIAVEDGTLEFRTEGFQVDSAMRLAVGELRGDVDSYNRWRRLCRETVDAIVPRLNTARRDPIKVPGDLESPHIASGETGSGPFLIRDGHFRDAMRSGPSPVEELDATIRVVGPVHPKLISTEMEGHGFMRAAHHYEIPAAVIKGISDNGDALKGQVEAETGGFFRVYACSNAVVTVVEALRRGLVRS